VTYDGRMTVTVDGVAAAPEAICIDGGDAVYVLRNGRQTIVKREDTEVDVEHLGGDGLVRAPMHGKILAILVGPGDTVAKGQRLAVIEAMKMEHALSAPVAGVVAEIPGTAGGQVAEGAVVMIITKTEDET
jgi:3-methylcrotonyl-CoA carboxylase alpha subunit